MDGRPSADAEKYNKLKEKYNQLKDAAKKEVNEKTLLCQKLEKQLKDKETESRQQLEEIDHLKFQNGRMSKQLGTLTAQVEEYQKQKQQSGWSVGGLISGKQQQEAIQAAEKEKNVMQEELVIKINENEELHMQLFEIQKQHQEEAQRFRESSAAAIRDFEDKVAELEDERSQTRRLLGETEEMSQKIESMESKLSSSQELVKNLEDMMEDERSEAKRQVGDLQARIARWVPFDDRQYEPWNLRNFHSRHGREVQRRNKAIQQLQASMAEACRQACGVLELWPKYFGHGSDEESASRLKVRSKMSETVQELGTLIEGVVAGVSGRLGLVQMQPSLVWGKDLHSAVATLLRTHRKWVVYQSLLLLHDWRSAYDCRSEQEETQARSFVACLWDLHRAVRALMAKLRVFSCVPVLLARDGSSAHFSLAREALGRRSAPGSTGAAPGPLQPRSDSTAGAATAVSAGGDRGGGAASAPQVFIQCVRGAVEDLSRSWDGIGRCLSSWAAAQGGAASTGMQDGNTVLELLGSIKRCCTCMVERVVPAMDQIIDDSPRRESDLPVADELHGRAPLQDAAGPVPPSSPSGYLSRAVTRLHKAPTCISFEESMRTRTVARRLAATSTRLTDELRQQVKRLQAMETEKNNLADEHRVLQDSHALLRSNYQVLQAMQDASAARGQLSAAPDSDPPPAAAAPPTAERPSAASDLVLSSRQRALLDSISVTAQENASLRQHGFFIDVLTLSTGEAQLAANGPPGMEALDSWETAVRKVYEQHTRNLQEQVRTADGTAMELYISTQQNADLFRAQDEQMQRLKDEVAAKHGQIDGLKEDLAMTRKSYDTQLALLTEHICQLSQRLSEKDTGLATLQLQRVLCGHCGTWNAMGKLLDQAGGLCQTCKEQVLS